MESNQEDLKLSDINLYDKMETRIRITRERWYHKVIDRFTRSPETALTVRVNLDFPMEIRSNKLLPFIKSVVVKAPKDLQSRQRSIAKEQLTQSIKVPEDSEMETFSKQGPEGQVPDYITHDRVPLPLELLSFDGDNFLFRDYFTPKRLYLFEAKDFLKSKSGKKKTKKKTKKKSNGSRKN